MDDRGVVGQTAMSRSAASALETAGASALEQAYQSELDIPGIEAQILGLNELLKRKRADARAWRAGATGEQDVIRVLVGIADEGWQVLADRRWPGTTRANIDVLLVGPGGVFVVDAKNWKQPRIDAGRLWRGDAPQDDAVEGVTAQADAVANVLANIGLPPTEVVPVLAFTGKHRWTVQLGPVTVLGELDLPVYLTRRGVRLDAGQVATVVAALDEGCPPNRGTAVAVPLRAGTAGKHRRAQIGGAEERSHDQPEHGALISEKEIVDALREAACQEPIESWMAWLHPTQAKLVAHEFNGPARIRGAAGTGKTVVALHRAKHLASRGQRVLVTSFVRTLPKVQKQIYRRLAPDADLVSGHVEFAGIHAWSMRLLRARNIAVDIDNDATATVFNLAWARVGRGSALENLGVGTAYWKDEIHCVIKGRAERSLESYTSLDRIGRRTPLQLGHREIVWHLFEEYERLRLERGVSDWSDVLALALASVRDSPVAPKYDSVIVDEVQDLTCVGIQLLHALVGDAADGLLLVGDGQQAVYPGGFTLLEAGVSVVGRSTILRRNYRNASDILDAALALVAGDAFDDLESSERRESSDVDVERLGGSVIRVTADTAASLEAALTTQILDAQSEHGVRLGDMGVLCPTNATAARWRRVLQQGQIPVLDLVDYDGRGTDAVKVGTFQRAKGLEFAYVFIPDHGSEPGGRGLSESVDAQRERSELARRQLFVAMTRARDGLWLGSTTRLMGFQ